MGGAVRQHRSRCGSQTRKHTDYTTACTELTTHICGTDLPHHHWQSDGSRHQCVTTTQIHTGHSPLLATGLHYVSPLQRCRRNGRESDLTVPDSWPNLAGNVAWPPNIFQPKMALVLPEVDQGGDSSPPLQMRDRQTELQAWLQVLTC